MSQLGIYQLPKGWAWATIPDLSGEAGMFIDGDWVESKDQDPKGDVRLVQLADVGDGVYRDKSDRFMTKAKADELRCTFLKDGDVLIARMPHPLGRACIFPGDAKPSVTVVDVAIVRSGSGEFDHRWLAYFVNAHPFRSAISGLQAGSTRKRISRGNLATIPLPVPPLPEQRRIVAELEKQFTRLEAGVAALRRAQANLKRYRAAVLKAACEGSLVPTEAELQKSPGQGPHGFETGEQLLARIRKVKAEKIRKGEIRKSRIIDRAFLTEPNESVPEGWALGRVEDFGAQEDNAIVDGPFGSNLKLSDYTPDGKYPVITITNIDEGFDLASLRKVTEEKFAEVKRSAVRAGDILVAKIGSSFGKTGIYPSHMPVGIIPANLLKVTPATEMNWKYLFYHLHSLTFKRHLDTIVQYTAQPAFNVSKFKLLPVPVPPLAEQTRIVAEVERRLSVVEELEGVVSANLQRATRLNQSILQQGFTGSLVPQNPADESAEMLLKRLKDLPRLPTPAKTKIKPKDENIMPSKPVTTLAELLQRLDSIGGAAAPDRLLAASGLGDEIEIFFDLLREGRNNGALIVPTGTSSDIKRNRHEN